MHKCVPSWPSNPKWEPSIRSTQAALRQLVRLVLVPLAWWVLCSVGKNQILKISLQALLLLVQVAQRRPPQASRSAAVAFTAILFTNAWPSAVTKSSVGTDLDK